MLYSPVIAWLNEKVHVTVNIATRLVQVVVLADEKKPTVIVLQPSRRLIHKPKDRVQSGHEH